MAIDERPGERRVALTGGIASGKSTVAAMFKSLGAEIIDADRAAREAVTPGSPGWLKLRSFLGAEFFDGKGNLLRSRLRSKIIEDPELRRRIDDLLHPEIVFLMEQKWQYLREVKGDCPVLFDIPLLFEAGLETGFDIVIVVYVPAEIQVQRLLSRDRLSPEEARRTLTMQMPIEEKKSRAHIIIDNSGPLQATLSQVKEAWKRLFNGS